MNLRLRAISGWGFRLRAGVVASSTDLAKDSGPAPGGGMARQVRNRRDAEDAEPVASEEGEPTSNRSVGARRTAPGGRAVGERSGPRGVPPHETRSDPLRLSSPAPASPRPERRYGVPMHDAAYKGLFSCRRMVEDLLRGFVAPEWSDALDFSTLEKLPAEYVSDDLRRRHGDVVWRVRFRDETWLYLLVMLEFQSTADPYMAVRILVYTGLLYQDLIRRGAVGDGGRLPPVLPVVLYNGRPRWSAPVEVARPHRPGGKGAGVLPAVAAVLPA